MNVKLYGALLGACLMVISAESQDVSWAKQAGGQGADQGYDVSVDAAGNVYVCGWFSGEAQFGTTSLTSYGLQDIFLAKYDSSGVFKWVKQAGSEGNEVCSGIVTNADGYSFITGWFSETADFDNLSITSAGSYDMFVARYNSDGIVQWVSRGGGPSDDYGNRITLAVDGGVCIGGSFRETAWIGDHELVSMGDRDVLLSHFSANGDVVCAKRAGGTGEDRAYGIYQDSDGSYYLTGFFSGTALFDDKELVSTSIISSFVTKMTNQGFFLWAVSLGGNANDFARGFDVMADTEGNVVATGFFSGSVNFGEQILQSTGGQYDFDVFLVKFNPLGEAVWALNPGSDGIDHGTSLYINSQGEIFLSGFYTQTGHFGILETESQGKSDIFATKVLADGTPDWVIGAGGPGNDYAYGIVNDISGSIYLTGVFEGTSEFGLNTLISAGGNDIFIAKIPSASNGFNRNINPFGVHVIPNPAGDFLLIGLDVFFNSKVDYHAEISSIDGKLLCKSLIESQTAKIDVSTFDPGTYVIKITGGGFSYTGKFIVK